jgi:transposase InsO family protein
MKADATRDINRKLKILRYGEELGNVSKACRYYGISRETYYQWKRALATKGETGLINSKPCPINLKRRVAPNIEEQILYLRSTYHFGQKRIVWYINRYLGMKVAEGGVRGVLLRHCMNRLPRNAKKRSPGPFIRYEKQVPGHQVQMDVKFLNLQSKAGKTIRRFQYSAIDDATRIRVLKIYPRHTQENAIAFMDHVVEKMPFRIKQIRTDNGHEFQALFHWHVLDKGMEHVYIKKGTPRLNGKVERSHRTDQEEFYQLIEYKGDTDLAAKLIEWERCYNTFRPHTAFQGRTPYEALKEKLGV